MTAPVDWSPELRAAVARVSVTFDALSKARAKFNRSRREDSRETARVVMAAADATYREASDARDRLVELERARATQRGGYPALSHDGPALKVPR